MLKKSWIVIVLCIALVMLESQCVSGVNDTCQIQSGSERGVISDRNGIVLVSNDTVMLPDSTGKMILRSYPRPVAAQLIGFVGEATQDDANQDEDCAVGEIVGKTGVEKYYDNVLRGKDGMSGKDLKLTIDYELQKMGEELLDGKTGSIIAIEPSTGEVLCMVSTPSYHPQLLSGYDADSCLQSLRQDDRKPLLNRCITGQYSPGSVFMPAQGLAFLSEDIISPETRYPCEKGFSYKGLVVGCHDHSSPLTLAEALGTTCNTYFCQAFLDMMSNTKYETVQDALEKWREHMLSLGFGHQLGIDLPYEKHGLMPSANFYDMAYKGQWSGLKILSIAIGQGEVQATPLQLANFSAAIANRGHYYIPHVVKEIQGEPINKKYKLARTTHIDRNDYDAVINGMRLSVSNGTCRALSKLPVESCGLSGMASSGEHNHSVFIGFAPVDNPKIAIAVYVENVDTDEMWSVPIGGLVIEKYLNGELSEISAEMAGQMRAQAQ